MAPSGSQGPGVILGAAQTLPRPPVHPQDEPGGKVVVGGLGGVVHEKVHVQECRGRQRSRHFHFPSQEGATIHRAETGAVEMLWDSVGLPRWPVYVTVLQLSPCGNQEGTTF